MKKSFWQRIKWGIVIYVQFIIGLLLMLFATGLIPFTADSTTQLRIALGSLGITIASIAIGDRNRIRDTKIALEILERLKRIQNRIGTS